jgi:hypothetical protein
VRVLSLRTVLTCLLACGLAQATPQYQTWGWQAGHAVSSAFVAILLVMLASRLRIAALCALHHRRQPPAPPHHPLPEEEAHPMDHPRIPGGTR